jgi:hypothetical protein
VLTLQRPKEEVEAIASKGGQSSHSGGFASMDPDKQVCHRLMVNFEPANPDSARSRRKEARPRLARLNPGAKRHARPDGRVDQSNCFTCVLYIQPCINKHADACEMLSIRLRSSRR